MSDFPRFAKATTSNSSTENYQLVFNVDEEIILTKAHDGGWFAGECRGASGYIHEDSFVLVPGPAAPALTPRPSLPSRPGPASPPQQPARGGATAPGRPAPGPAFRGGPATPPPSGPGRGAPPPSGPGRGAPPPGRGAPPGRVAPSMTPPGRSVVAAAAVAAAAPPTLTTPASPPVGRAPSSPALPARMGSPMTPPRDRGVVRAPGRALDRAASFDCGSPGSPLPPPRSISTSNMSAATPPPRSPHMPIPGRGGPASPRPSALASSAGASSPPALPSTTPPPPSLSALSSSSSSSTSFSSSSSSLPLSPLRSATVSSADADQPRLVAPPAPMSSPPTMTTPAVPPISPAAAMAAAAAATSTAPLSPHHGGRATISMVTPRASQLAAASPDKLAADLGMQKELVNALFQTLASRINARLLHVVLEFYTSEVSYFMSLGRIVNSAIPLAGKCFPKDAQMVQKLFGNVADIYGFHAQFLAGLFDQYKKWGEASCIGAQLRQAFAQLRPLYVDYCRGYENANQTIINLSKSKKMHKLSDKVHHTCEQPLPALLIMPVQRLPRYRMLLEDWIKHVDASHPDFPELQAAMTTVGEVADTINQELREAASQITAQKVLSTVKGSEAFQDSGKRRIVADAPNIRITVLQAESVFRDTQKSITSYDRAVLLTDAIVFCSAPSNPKPDPRHVIREQVPIHLLWIDDNIPDKCSSDARVSLRLLTPATEYIVECASILERETWRSTVQNCIQSCLEANGMTRLDAKGELVRSFDFHFNADSSLLPGAAYSGEWVHARPSGAGRITYANGQTYAGQLLAGQLSGAGKMVWSSGSSYEGQWMKDLPHGEGVLQRTDYVYRGGWYLGRRHGKQCSSTWTRDQLVFRYEGDFNNDRFGGSGELSVADLYSYVGEFADDHFHGQGTLRLASGDEYTGTWCRGVLHGRGVLVSGHCRYEGDWQAGLVHGKGTLRYTGADVQWSYEGDFVNGRKSGVGTVQYANGDSYTGHWEFNTCHGAGVYRSPASGVCYDGAFVHGAWEGQGTLTSPHYAYKGQFRWGLFDGVGELRSALPQGGTMVYKGHFKEGLRDGEGVLHYEPAAGASLIVYTGAWANGRPHGLGKYSAPNMTYDGEWQNGRFHGSGKLTTLSRSPCTYSGSFVEGRREGRGALVVDRFTVTGSWLHGRISGDCQITEDGKEKPTTFKDGLMHVLIGVSFVPVFHPDDHGLPQPIVDTPIYSFLGNCL